MATLPTYSDVRTLVTGYCIDSTVIPDAWITSRMTNYVVPYVEKVARTTLTGAQTVTEYFSGTGENVLMMHRKNVTAITNIEFVVGGGTWFFNLTNVELISDDGIIKAKRNVNETWIRPYFPKGDQNLKITYTYGYENTAIPADLSEAVILLTCEQMLGFLEGQAGGGDYSVTGFGTSYGSRGKWTHVRQDFSRKAHSILKQYISLVVGNV